MMQGRAARMQNYRARGDADCYSCCAFTRNVLSMLFVPEKTWVKWQGSCKNVFLNHADERTESRADLFFTRVICEWLIILKVLTVKPVFPEEEEKKKKLDSLRDVLVCASCTAPASLTSLSATISWKVSQEAALISQGLRVTFAPWIPLKEITRYWKVEATRNRGAALGFVHILRCWCAWSFQSKHRLDVVGVFFAKDGKLLTESEVRHGGVCREGGLVDNPTHVAKWKEHQVLRIWSCFPLFSFSQCSPAKFSSRAATCGHTINDCSLLQTVNLIPATQNHTFLLSQQGVAERRGTFYVWGFSDKLWSSFLCSFVSTLLTYKN